MPRPTVLKHRLNVLPLQLWTWTIVALFAGVCAAITWLHYDQEASLHLFRQWLTRFRVARIDLAMGFLHLTQAGDPRSPFQRPEGIALLDQAIRVMQELEAQFAATSPKGSWSPELGKTFQAKTMAFRNQLIATSRSEQEVHPDHDLHLFQAFHELEDLAGKVDMGSQDALEALSTKFRTRFKGILFASTVLLGGMSLGTYRAGQRQRRTEEALRLSQDRYRELVENANSAILRWRSDGRITFFNDFAQRFFGYTAEEAIGKHVGILVPEVDTTGRDLATLVQDIVAYPERHVNVVNENVCRDGRRVWFAWTNKPVFDAQGAVTEILAIGSDITERKRTEATLRENEARLREAHRLALLGDWEWDLRQDRHTWSKEVYEFYGRDPSLPPASYPEVQKYFTPESWANLVVCVERALADGRSYECDVEVVRSDGTRRWIIARGEGVRDAAGALTLLRGTVQDITQRKQAEADLRESEARRALALHAAHAGTWEWDPATGQNTWSEELWALYGLEPHSCETSYEAWRETVHPEDRDRIERELRALVEQEVEISLEWRVKNSGKSSRWLLSCGRPLRSDSGRVVRYLGVVMDITERKRLEHERIALEAQIRHQQKLESIGTLASGVAHEINNPINGILNYAQLIQDRLPGDSPLTEFTGEIMRETQRVATIVRNLLTFARNEKQNHSPARISDIIEAVLSLVRTVLRHDQITLNIDVPTDLPEVKCRSQQIEQVIMNLVTNARDALNERYPGHHPDKILNLKARASEKSGRRWIRITAEDHGTGIPPAVRDRIFDPFFTTKGRNHGTGLGLSISHGIVQEHHGEWSVESEYGRYTRMHVDLPADNGWDL